jgi:hypothetical protein
MKSIKLLLRFDGFHQTNRISEWMIDSDEWIIHSNGSSIRLNRSSIRMDDRFGRMDHPAPDWIIQRHESSGRWMIHSTNR